MLSSTSPSSSRSSSSPSRPSSDTGTTNHLSPNCFTVVHLTAKFIETRNGITDMHLRGAAFFSQILSVLTFAQFIDTPYTKFVNQMHVHQSILDLARYIRT